MSTHSGRSTLSNRPVLILSVESGPEKGKAVRFDQARISVGRDPRNDFVLNDQFVSSGHGEFFRTEEGFAYQDLGSLHGTVVSVKAKDGAGKMRVSDPIQFDKDGVMKVGASRLGITIDRVFHSEKESGASRLNFSGEDDSEVMASRKMDGVDASRVAAEDSRMEVLYRLAMKLNSLSHVDEIVEFIASSAFEAFPKSNLFSISLMEKETLRPVLVRTANLNQAGNVEVIMSRTMVARVVDTHEAVLFVSGGDQGLAPSRSIVQASISSCMCAPLKGQRKLLGVMQMDTRQGGRFNQSDLDLFCILASHAAFALERAALNANTHRMFEGFVQASVMAIEARDPSTAGHSERVAKYSLALAEAVNDVAVDQLADLHFTPTALTELRYAALLHDFGKVGVRESVLNKAGRLDDLEMRIMAQRFQLIQSEYKHKLLEELIRNAAKKGSSVDPASLQLIEKKAQKIKQGLDGEWQFIDGIRGKFRLEPAEMLRLENFAKQSFTTAKGEVLPFLSMEELEKLSIPTGTLNEAEWEDMRSHVSKSERFLQQIPWSDDLRDIPCIAGNHHEKIDGSGYPKGLKGKDINPRVRILTIADIFDAATAWDRPYCVPITVEQAGTMLRKQGEGGQLDLSLVNLFVDRVLSTVDHLVPKSA